MALAAKGLNGSAVGSISFLAMAETAFAVAACRTNNRIQVFSNNGTFIREPVLAPQTMRVSLGPRALPGSRADVHLRSLRP